MIITVCLLLLLPGSCLEALWVPWHHFSLSSPSCSARGRREVLGRREELAGREGVRGAGARSRPMAVST